MFRRYKTCIAIFLHLFLLQSAFSQTTLITGRVRDSASRKLLPLATVTVFKAKDTVIISYRLTNQDGEFRIPNLPMQTPLRLMVTFSGYEAYRRDFTLTGAHLSFDSVFMAPTSKQLDEVLVMAERPPVVIKNDTIEFNATAFKTLPNALVEDLLKKLPGVMIDADGNITVNGKPVNRILVDGKNFFGSDPKMASRNLPANVIDKVQVMDDKEEMLRNGDDNINNVGKVVNITLKKGVKKGWFGKAYAGAGSKHNYEAGAIANMFRDTLQLSVLGYANTLNKPGFGFTDLMQTAGLSRTSSVTGSSSASLWTNGSGSGISVNGISFGGLQSYGGVATSKGAGININHAPNTKNSFFAQYFMGNVLVDRRTQTATQQQAGDTLIGNKTLLTGGVQTFAHNIGIGAKLNPDSVTSILANASYTLGTEDEDRFSAVTGNNSRLGLLSTGNIVQYNLGHTYVYKHSLSITHLSPVKKGRRYTISHNFNQNNRFYDYTTASQQHFFYPSDADSSIGQLRNERVPRTDLNAAFNYSEPLIKSFTLRLGGMYEYGRLFNNVNTFNQNTVNQKYDLLNPGLTSAFTRESNRFFVNAGMEYKRKDLTITPAAQLLFQEVRNYAVAKNIRQEDNRLLPALTVSYKHFNFNYRREVTLPEYTYLIPVLNNTDPYMINRGNENLLPSIKDNFSVGNYFNDVKRSINLGLNGGLSFINNDIVSSVEVNEKGIQTSTPINVNGSSSWWLNYNLRKQYKQNPKFIFSWFLGAFYSYIHSHLFFNGDASWQATWTLNQWAGVNLNFNDKFEWNTTYSMGNNFTRYSSDRFREQHIPTQYGNTEVILRMPKHVIWESSLTYIDNKWVGTSAPVKLYLWNAAVNFTMLKDERGVLRLSINDIFDQNKSVNSVASRNLTTFMETNALGRYFLATFTYNIRPGGAKKKVGGDKLFLF